MRQISIFMWIVLFAIIFSCSSTKPDFVINDRYGDVKYYINEDGTELISIRCTRQKSNNSSSNWEQNLIRSAAQMTTKVIKKAHPEVRRSKNLNDCIASQLKGKDMHLTSQGNNIVMYGTIRHEKVKEILECANW